MATFQRNLLCLQLFNHCLKLDSPSRKSMVFFDHIYQVDVEILEDAIVRLLLRYTFENKTCTYQVELLDVQPEELMTFFHENLSLE